MRILYFLTLTLVWLLSLTPATAGGDDKLHNRMTIFIQQTNNRIEKTLTKDAALIGNFLLSAKPGDEVQLLTTDVTDIFQYHLPPGKTKPMQVKRAQNQAIAQLRAFFNGLIKNPPKDDAENNIAEAIALAIERVNAAEPYQQYTLVILGSALQVTEVMDWRGHYPTPSWITHELSPFSQIPRNRKKGKSECIIVPERGNYINSHHKRKIQEWYSWLLGYKAVYLTAFSSDHSSVYKVLKRGARPAGKLPMPPDLNGDLELIAVGRLAPAEDK